MQIILNFIVVGYCWVRLEAIVYNGPNMSPIFKRAKYEAHPQGAKHETHLLWEKCEAQMSTIGVNHKFIVNEMVQICDEKLA